MSYSLLLDWKVTDILDINSLAEVKAVCGWTALSHSSSAQNFLLHLLSKWAL